MLIVSCHCSHLFSTCLYISPKARVTSSHKLQLQCAIVRTSLPMGVPDSEGIVHPSLHPAAQKDRHPARLIPTDTDMYTHTYHHISIYLVIALYLYIYIYIYMYRFFFLSLSICISHMTYDISFIDSYTSTCRPPAPRPKWHERSQRSVIGSSFRRQIDGRAMVHLLIIG